jgi:hypothetical protein
MKRSNNPVEKISEQVARLEARERMNRRRRWLLVGFSICLLALGGASMVRPAQRHPKPRRLVAADTLTTQRVAFLFQESRAPLVVYHRHLQDDTVQINNLYEYQLYSEDIAARTTPQPPEPMAMPSFSVSVRGDRKVGEWLTYEVAPFDTAHRLILDFGNGITRPVRQAKTTYRYPLPGHFDMHLRLVEGDSTIVLQTLQYEILAAEPAEVTVEETTPPQPELTVVPVSERPFLLASRPAALR